MDKQIDFDILPSDVFEQRDKFGTKLGKKLVVNNKEYKVLVIPYSQYITKSVAKALIEMKRADFPVIFIDDLPIGIVDGENELLIELSGFKVVKLDTLVSELKEHRIPELIVEPAFPMLRCLHYREENDLYIFTNENMAETFCGTVTVPLTGHVYGYDAWKNELYELKTEQNANTTLIHMEVSPYHSVVVVFDQAAEVNLKASLSYDNEMILENGWIMSIATAKEYPAFHDVQEISGFANVGLKYPQFSGFIRYENMVEVPELKKAFLIIEDAFEGVEVFVNGVSAGIQVAPPFVFDITNKLRSGKNKLCIEVATTLERERHFAPPISGDFGAMLSLKPPVLEPSGIVGRVKLLLESST